jgi:hypothetical protein
MKGNQEMMETVPFASWMDDNHDKRQNNQKKIKTVIKSSQEMETSIYSIWPQLKETIKNWVEDTPL